MSEFDSEKITDSVKKTVDSGKGLIKRAKTKSPPKEIEAIRKGFENALKQLDVMLVVLIDDLDRCLPQTAISTLEAIRLLLFLKNTAFVIAADTAIIKHAVSKHFEGMEEKIAASYFDKLIQIPVAVPKLSLPDIKAYMSLLYIENSDIDKNLKEEIRKTICDSLKRTWDNQKFDAFDIVKRIKELGIEVTSRLREQLQTVERLAPMMTADTAIEANPRLIKRFMNAISFQRDIGKILDIDLDERILAKFLLLERCGSASSFNAIKESISEHPKGFSKVIGDIELQLQQGKKSEDQEIYKDAFLQKWVASEPSLKEVDLRPYMYISREHAPLLASGERISTKALDLLEAIIGEPKMADSIQEDLNSLNSSDLRLMMQKVLEIARRIKRWGIPDILTACIAICRAAPSLGDQLATFLGERPPKSIEPSIVQLIKSEPWAQKTFNIWLSKDISSPVRIAIRKV